MLNRFKQGDMVTDINGNEGVILRWYECSRTIGVLRNDGRIYSYDSENDLTPSSSTIPPASIRYLDLYGNIGRMERKNIIDKVAETS